MVKHGDIARSAGKGSMGTIHRLYVGIDSHSQTHKVALIPAEDLQNHQKSLKKSELLDVCNSLSDFRRLGRAIRKYTSVANEVVIGIDSCGFYTLPITYYLQSLEFRVFYMEQKLSKTSRGYLFDLENKSDVIDAIRIAYLLYLKDLAGSLFRSTALKVPDFDSKASILHTLILHRQQYNKLIAQSTNRLHVFLIGIFPEAEKQYFTRLLRILPHYPTPQEIARSRGMRKVNGVGTATKNAIKELARETVGIPAWNYRTLILNLCRQREQALAWRKEISDSIEKEVNEHPYGAVLLSFPCFGTVAAATIIGMIGDIERWASDKKLKKALGLYGTFQESGKSLSLRKPGRGGNRLCKTALYQVVMRCLTDKAPENDFKDYYRRKVSRGKSKISAIVSTMGKLTEIMYHCLKTGEPYCYKGIYKKSRDKIKKMDQET